jgi:predicted phosphodiesterase
MKPKSSVHPSKKLWYAMVIPDTHVGYVVDNPTYSVGAWDIAIQALKHNAKRLTHLVFLGDFGNWESLSHWASLRADQVFIEEDVALVNARLDEIEEITKANNISVSFCEGNHEAWASMFEAKYPALRDGVNLKRRLKFKERGWTWVPENNFYALGDIYFTHGHLRGVKTPVDMVKRTGASVIYGHTHHYVTQSVRTLKGEHAAWTFGCLASIDPPPPYTKGDCPSGWVQGFGFVQIRQSGNFQVSFRRIIDESWTELEDGTELLVNTKSVQKRLDQDKAIRENLRKEYSERYWIPGGRIVTPEPIYGTISKKGEVGASVRTRRARIVSKLPERS